MALRTRYQEVIELDTLYEVRASGLGVEQLAQSIEVIGGTVDIYVSQVDPTVGAAPTGMNIISNGAGFVGSGGFEFVQNYLYIEQDAGATTSIVLAGFDVKEVV